MRYAFEQFVLDTEQFELRRDGDIVPVEPQVFDVLVHLLEHRDRVVPKTELLDEIWGDQFVSESALTSRIKAARRAIGDDGRTQRLIKTVHGRGYRFVGEVAGGPDGVVPERPPVTPAPHRDLVDGASTAVLRAFVFTDIERSTDRWEREPEQMRADVLLHDELVAAAVEGCGGEVFKTTGDGVCASFESPLDAVATSIALVAQLRSATWSTSGGIRARIGIHVGEVEARGGDYFGAVLNRTARITAAASGGQILCSSAVQEMVAGDLPPGVRVVSRGRYQLRGLDERIRLHEVVAPGGELGPVPRARATDTLAPLPGAKPAFGRRDHLDRIAERLVEGRLVTIVGPAGIGKSHCESGSTGPARTGTRFGAGDET